VRGGWSKVPDQINFSAPMTGPLRLFFDFVDPLSFLADRAVDELEAAGAPVVERVGLELRPPPAPLASASDPFWAPRWQAARRVRSAHPLVPPALVPWSRKAHELHALAAARGLGPALRRALFDAYHRGGRDIGRNDVLLEIAVSLGLDRTETKAALDVDRWTDAVLEARELAHALGVVELPALAIGARIVQGFQNLADLGTLLRGPP
jgi:2-hydroxychromene-2-carboxylate isomerase